VADSSVVTIYNRHRRYERAPVSPDGDHSDWFALSPEVAVAMAREIDPRAPDEPERAYRFEAARSDHALYLAQRRLFLALDRGVLDPLAAEEAVLALVETVLRRAAGFASAAPSRGSSARRDLVERAKAELARDVSEHTDVTALARRLGVSPSHLCRVFRQATGRTLHEHRLELRLRAALEPLGAPDSGLSRTAAALGFSSHSHFTAALRRRHGRTPSETRALLSGNQRTAR
jgi:AraC-like DNA-binding protein